MQLCSFSTHKVVFTGNLQPRLSFGRSTLPSSLGAVSHTCRTSGMVSEGRSITAELPFPLFCSTDFHSVIQFSWQYKPPYTYCTSPGTWQLSSMEWMENNQHSSSFLPLSLQAGEQTASVFPRVPLEQKGRRDTLRQRNVLADYQETFFFSIQNHEKAVLVLTWRAQQSSCGMGNQ